MRSGLDEIASFYFVTYLCCESIHFSRFVFIFIKSTYKHAIIKTRNTPRGYNIYVLEVKKERGKCMKKEIIVSGMTCGHCVKRVENTLLGIEGVNSVVVSLDEKSATIEVDDKIEDQLLKEAIEDVGYDVEAIQ